MSPARWASTSALERTALADGLLVEDLLLSLATAHLTPSFKTIGELGFGRAPARTLLRCAGPDPRCGAPPHARSRLLVAAAHFEDLIDFCYVKDAAGVMAMRQLAPELRHRTYNVTSAPVTSNLGPSIEPPVGSVDEVGPLT